MKGTGGPGSPVFVRIFLLLLLCVGVVQLMNMMLLASARTPAARLYAVGQIADVFTTGTPNALFEVDRTVPPRTHPWHPRGARAELNLAVALGVSRDRVRFVIPSLFLLRDEHFDENSVPLPRPPADPTSARRNLVIGEFDALVRQDDGSWLRVRPRSGSEAWRWLALLWLAVSVLAVVPFAWVLARRFSRPIAAFAEAADRLGRDPRAPPMVLRGPAEIAEAGAAFNRMQARINRYVEDRSTVAAAVAHDLRTPLMRLALRLERAPDPIRSACEADIADMQAMLSSAMAYMRDGGEIELRPLDLRSLAETVIDSMSDRGDALTLERGDPLVVNGNAAALKAMITNLASNAVRYAGSGAVSLERVGDRAVLDVCDDGPGVAEAELPRIFEPFFRSEVSRRRGAGSTGNTGSTGGIGLGLASVRAVAQAHGGDVGAENRLGGGLRVWVSLPL